MSDLLARYLACWNADAASCAQRVADVFTDDARYVDPMADVTGVEAIVATIAAVRAQFPDFVFSAVDATVTPNVAGVVDTHHDVARFRWGMGPAGAEPVIVGADTVVLDGDGRISLVAGFLDKVPS